MKLFKEAAGWVSFFDCWPVMSFLASIHLASREFNSMFLNPEPFDSPIYSLRRYPADPIIHPWLRRRNHGFDMSDIVPEGRPVLYILERHVCERSIHFPITVIPG